MEIIFLLMGVSIGLTAGGLISCIALEKIVNQEAKKPNIEKEVYKTIGSDISLYELTYGRSDKDEW